MGKILILDTETTGVANHPTLGHPEVIELVYLEVDNSLNDISKVDSIYVKRIVNNYSIKQRYRPEMPIHPEAFKVHGILFKDLLNKPKSSTCKLPEDVEYIVGHNVTFDHRCLGKPEVKQICTMGLAKAINKKFKLEIGSFKLDNLNVHFYGEDARNVIKEYHDATTDVVKTILLLTKLLSYLPTINTFEGLYNFQQLLKAPAR